MYVVVNFVTVALPTLLPIMIVLLNHFTSLHSFNRIFKMLWMRTSTSVESNTLNQVTVQLDALTVEESSEFLPLKSDRDKSSSGGSGNTSKLHLQHLLLKKISSFLSSVNYNDISDEQLIVEL